MKGRTVDKNLLRNTNVVFLREDGIIYKAYRGDQNGDSIRKLRQETEKLSKQLRAQGKPIFILVDLSTLGKTTLFARTAEIEFIRSLDFDKAACFGDSFLNRSLAKFIVNFSGMAYKIKFFNSEVEALDWLRRD